MLSKACYQIGRTALTPDVLNNTKLVVLYKYVFKQYLGNSRFGLSIKYKKMKLAHTVPTAEGLINFSTWFQCGLMDFECLRMVSGHFFP